MCVCVIGRERERGRERKREADRQTEGGTRFSFYNRWLDLNLNLILGLGMRSMAFKE